MTNERLVELKHIVEEDYSICDRDYEYINKDGEDIISLIDAELDRNKPTSEATIRWCKNCNDALEDNEVDYCEICKDVLFNQQPTSDEVKRAIDKMQDDKFSCTCPDCVDYIKHYDLAITALHQMQEPESTRSQMKRKLSERKSRIEQLEKLNQSLMAEIGQNQEPCGECKNYEMDS